MSVVIKKIINKIKHIPAFLVFTIIVFFAFIYFEMTEKKVSLDTLQKRDIFETKEEIENECNKAKESARMRIDDLSVNEIAESYGSVIDEINDGRNRFWESANDIRKGKYRIKDE